MNAKDLFEGRHPKGKDGGIEHRLPGLVSRIELERAAQDGDVGVGRPVCGDRTHPEIRVEDPARRTPKLGVIGFYARHRLGYGNGTRTTRNGSAGGSGSSSSR